MNAVMRALIGLLTLGVCLVVSAPGAAARTLPVGPAGAVSAVAQATAPSELPAWPASARIGSTRSRIEFCATSTSRSRPATRRSLPWR